MIMNNSPQTIVLKLQTMMMVLLLGLICTFTLAACDEESSNTPEEVRNESGRTQLLKSIRANVVIPLLNGFEPKLTQLTQSIAEKDLDQSRLAWQEAMLYWQQIELLQFGPAGVSGLRIGGQDLRDQIYAFPLTNPCRVDQVLVNNQFSESGWAREAPINVTGLDAMEHLLFRNGTDSACPSQTKIIRDGDWTLFQANESNAIDQKWAYLTILVDGIKLHYETLLSAWTGSFGQAFEDTKEPFRSQKEAIDQVFAGIFYIDEVVKDLKLGAPVGIYMTCLEERCPELLEHQQSQLSGPAIINNLKALRAVFRGTISENSDENGRFGFTQLLTEEGAVDLGNQLESLIDLNIDRASTLSDSFDQLLTENPQQLEELHSSVKELCDLIKSQMVTVLNLSVPQEGAGDND